MNEEKMNEEKMNEENGITITGEEINTSGTNAYFIVWG